MRIGFWKTLVPVVAMAFICGCGQPANVPSAAEKTQPETAHEHTASSEKSHHHDHSGWWCNEHGVPEEVCGLCSSKMAAEFQKKGDWCKDHDRPDSQCFKCHPELQEKFAAQYEAKFGKKPPTPEG